MKRCKKCGIICQDDQNFCGECGSNIESNFTYICNYCGRIYPGGSVECPKCHTKPDIPLPATSADKAKELQEAAVQKAGEFKEKASVAATVAAGAAASLLKTASEKTSEAGQKAADFAKTASEKASQKTVETKEKINDAVQNTLNQDRTASNNKLLIAIIVAALVIGGLGGYMLFGRSSDGKNSVVQSQQPAPTHQPQVKTATTQNIKKKETTRFIVGTDVNARGKASTDSAVVSTFKLGENVTILADEGEWARVKRANGQECYVFKKFLGTQEDLDKRQARYNLKSGPYPVFLNGNPNYILVDAHMGGAWYIIKNSVKKEQDSPGKWHIYCEVVSATETGKISSGNPRGYTFFFDEQNRTGAIAHKGLQFFNYNGPRSETMIVNGTGAMAYYLAMGKKWPKFGYNNDFYSRADL